MLPSPNNKQTCQNTHIYHSFHPGIIKDYVYAKINQSYRARHYHLNEPGKFQGEEKAHRFNQLLYKGLAEQMITLNQAALLRNITVGALRNDLDQLA